MHLVTLASIEGRVKVAQCSTCKLYLRTYTNLSVMVGLFDLSPILMQPSIYRNINDHWITARRRTVLHLARDNVHSINSETQCKTLAKRNRQRSIYPIFHVCTSLDIELIKLLATLDALSIRLSDF